MECIYVCESELLYKHVKRRVIRAHESCLTLSDVAIYDHAPMYMCVLMQCVHHIGERHVAWHVLPYWQPSRGDSAHSLREQGSLWPWVTPPQV